MEGCLACSSIHLGTFLIKKCFQIRITYSLPVAAIGGCIRGDLVTIPFRSVWVREIGSGGVFIDIQLTRRRRTTFSVTIEEVFSVDQFGANAYFEQLLLENRLNFLADLAGGGSILKHEFNAILIASAI